MALKPVYTPKEGGHLHSLFQASRIAKEALEDSLIEFEDKYPELKNIVIFSVENIGFKEDNIKDIKKYEGELKVRPYHGVRVFKKNSKTLRIILGELESYITVSKNSNNYQLYLTDYFDYYGQTSFNTQTFNEKLYLSCGLEALPNEAIEEVDYPEYLRLLAEAHERNRGCDYHVNKVV